MLKGVPFAGEFKQKVIEDMRTRSLSYHETARKIEFEKEDKKVWRQRNAGISYT